MIETEK